MCFLQISSEFHVMFVRITCFLYLKKLTAVPTSALIQWCIFISLILNCVLDDEIMKHHYCIMNCFQHLRALNAIFSMNTFCLLSNYNLLIFANCNLATKLNGGGDCGCDAAAAAGGGFVKLYTV